MVISPAVFVYQKILPPVLPWIVTPVDSIRTTAETLTACCAVVMWLHMSLSLTDGGYPMVSPVPRVTEIAVAVALPAMICAAVYGVSVVTLLKLQLLINDGFAEFPPFPKVSHRVSD